MSENFYRVCPFSGQEFFIAEGENCPACGRPHKPFKYIKGKKLTWYIKQDQWITVLVLQIKDFFK